MKRIVLLSCVSLKGKTKAKAKDLYISALFKYSLAYAEALNPDKIYILSALHHVLELEDEIEPYDVTLSYVSPQKKKPELKVLTKQETTTWGQTVIKQLEQITNVKEDTFTVLAGNAYLAPIQNSLGKIEQPLKGVKMFDRIKKLKELIKETNGK